VLLLPSSRGPAMHPLAARQCVNVISKGASGRLQPLALASEPLLPGGAGWKLDSHRLAAFAKSATHPRRRSQGGSQLRPC